MAVYVRDTFSRVVASSWGTPNIGPAWSTEGVDSSTIGVNGSQGTWAVTAQSNGVFFSSATPVTESRMELTLTLDKVPVGGNLTPRLIGRRFDGLTDYHVRFSFKPGGAVTIAAARGDVAFVVGEITTSLTYTANTPVRLVAEVMGTSPTTIRGKIWQVGDPEPGWTLDATDNTAGYQAAGYPAMRLNQQSAVTNKPVAYAIDNLVFWDGVGSPTGLDVSVWNGVSEVTGYTVAVWDGVSEQPAEVDSLG